MNSLFGKKKSGSRRTVVTETTATQIGQSRIGIKTSLVPVVDSQVVSNRLISTAVIPYMRSRNVLVQVKKLKPNTKFYPFFDGISVSDYCTPASTIVWVPSGSDKQSVYNSVDVSTPVGDSNEPARYIDNNSQACLNRGDIVTGGSSGATAVVVGKQYDPATNTYYINVLNVIGTFQASETLSFSISHASGTVTSISSSILGGDLITSASGEIQLLFNIPNSDKLKFRCGSREFKLQDSSSSTGNFTSRARTNYEATGVIQTNQQTINSVRSEQLVESIVTQSQTVTSTSQRIISDTGWHDPLAQSFMVTVKGGCFLTKFDIFFASKDSNIPVTLEVRNMVNGYPGQNVLPFSQVTLTPDQVNISSNTVTLEDGTSVPSYDTATSFTFPSPVYVQENTEYCVVLTSDSTQYTCWVAQMGDTVPGTTRTVSEQPYLGVLFKSQNASTWSADQSQDLMFTAYRASFDTSSVADVELVNDKLPLDLLAKDPFEFTSGSNVVRVWHNNHQMTDGSYVKLAGAVGTNGVSAGALNTTFQISNSDLDSYEVTIVDSATVSGYGGGAAIMATANAQFDCLQPSVQVQSFPDANVSVSVAKTSQQYVKGDYTDVTINDNNTFGSPYIIASGVNETNKMSGDKSFSMRVQMSTENEAVSPVLDLHRTSLIAVANKVDSNGYSKYVTKNINLANPSTMLHVMFSVNLPKEADVQVWYKTDVSTDYQQIANPDAVITRNSNETNTFIDTSYSAEGLQSFLSVTVKIVLNSTNSSEVPRVKDLRVIALA